MIGQVLRDWRRQPLVLMAAVITCIVLSVVRPLAVRNGVYELYRAYGWQKVRWERRDMNLASSEGVQVYYTDGDQASAKLVLSLFDQYRAEVDADFGYVNRSAVQVVIHPSRRSLADSMGWASGDSALGVYWGGSIKLLSPKVWLAGREQAEVERLYRKSGPVVHEYTHLVIDQLTSGNVPRWLTEGLAQVEEQRLTGYLWLEAGSRIEADNIYPFTAMNSGYDQLPNQALAYHQSYTLARFLMEKEGQERVNDLLRELGRGYTLEQAFQRVLGCSLSEYERMWQEWVLSEYQMGAS